MCIRAVSHFLLNNPMSADIHVLPTPPCASIAVQLSVRYAASEFVESDKLVVDRMIDAINRRDEACGVFLSHPNLFAAVCNLSSYVRRIFPGDNQPLLDQCVKLALESVKKSRSTEPRIRRLAFYRGLLSESGRYFDYVLYAMNGTMDGWCALEPLAFPIVNWIALNGWTHLQVVAPASPTPVVTRNRRMLIAARILPLQDYDLSTLAAAGG